jgi:hypothetical protein
MDNNSLYKSLYVLFEKVKEIIDAAKATNSMVKIPYEKIHATNIDYEHENFQYDYENIEYFDFYKWGTDPFDEHRKLIEALPEYESVTDEICKAFEIPDEGRRITQNAGVFSFARLLMNNIPNGIIHYDNIDSYIKTFLNDYETYKTDNKFTWQIQIWLDSIYFEGDQIELSPQVTLRKPILEELHLVRPKSHYISDFNKAFGNGLPSVCILEFSMKAEMQAAGRYHDDIKYEIENWLDALRLFKVGNINAIYKSIAPISILVTGTTENSATTFDTSWKDKIEHSETSNYKYPIQKQEAEQLYIFAQKLKPILKTISQKSYHTGSYLDIAFHRYKDCLLRSEVNVNRMISAITCLEALLSNSSSEITYKISIHVAGVLKHLGFNTIMVFEKMKLAYSVRSTLLHGSNLNNKLLEFSKDHTHEIVNYARLCLLISMQLKDNIKKDDFIKIIDHSFIDEKANTELKMLIQKNVSISIIYPFRSFPEGDTLIDL